MTTTEETITLTKTEMLQVLKLAWKHGYAYCYDSNAIMYELNSDEHNGENFDSFLQNIFNPFLKTK